MSAVCRVRQHRVNVESEMTFFWWNWCYGKTHSDKPGDTSDNDFDNPGADNLIGLWDFRDGAKTKDTGLADGIAQNGHLHGNAYISNGALHLDGSHDYFDVSGEDAPFDLSRGTIEVEFTQKHHVGSSPDVLVNRGEYCDRATEGYFNIQVTEHGQVQLMHHDGGKSVTLSTGKYFFNEGDDVRVAYSFDAATGGKFVVENVTKGTVYSTDHHVTGLSMDVGDNDDENFTFGAREVDDGQYDQFFKGEINYVAVYSDDLIGTGDGIVEGSAGDDVIDLAYTGDPEGDMIDNGDAILPGEGPDDDIVHAGAGADTVVAGKGDDEIWGDKGEKGIATTRESFEWDKLPDPDKHGSGFVDHGDDLEDRTFVQDTGHVKVTVKTPDDSERYGTGVESSYSEDRIVTDGIDGGGETVDNTSALMSLAEKGEKANYEIGFDKQVTGVDFRITDIDADRGQVTIRAWNAAGQEVPVTLTAGSGLTVSGQTATSKTTNNASSDDANHSVLVEVAGPVAKIIVTHTNAGYGNSGIYISDIYFDAPTGAPAADDGDDDLSGGIGNDLIYGEGGDDTIRLENDFGNDTIVGGETGETKGDTLDATAVTDDTTVTFSNPETGTVSDGSFTANFAEIENVLLGSGDDDVTGSAGNDKVDLGRGADYADMGAGDDTVGLGRKGDGTPDGDADLVKFSDGDGNDLLTDFDTPVDNGDGTYTGIDKLDVTDLTNGAGDPVDTDDVTVTDTPQGARLTFPNGESITLKGVPVSAVQTPEQLNAIGIPLPPVALDGIVEGTDGDDLIDLAYTGDPEGDRIDAGDAILPGDAPNDDYVLAGAGNDTVKAGEGDDRVYGEDGDDELYGEAGNDLLSGGAGHDTIKGGDGRDTVYGGDGDDVIDTSGSKPASDYGYPGLVAQDADPNDDRDLVDGGAGNDSISTGDDADTVYGGSGNDTIDGGLDDDHLFGGDGNDSIIGGHGSDYIEGGAGNDTIWGGTTFDPLNIPDENASPHDLRPDNARDTIKGGDGNDVIYGEDDDDLLYGDAGNDTIDGGIDDDTIHGGAGNDSLKGGDGADLIYGDDGNDTIDLGGDVTADYADVAQGGADRDTFVKAGIGDTVVGGETGDDYDTLDLSGSGPIRINYTSTDPDNLSGTVDFLDGVGGPVKGSMTFSEIENVIPCFTPGTLIATPKGERLVEDLAVGDKIITRDNGIQEIRWLGAKTLDWKALAAAPHLKPILVRAGSLGNGLPERDMMVSPNHRVLVANDRTALYFEEREVLAAAKHMVNNRGIHEVEVMGATYIHFMFDNHEVVLSNGAWTESFQPGDYTLEGIGNAQRTEILELFPELETSAGREAYQSARRTLKKHEARLLAD